MTLEALPAAI